MTVRSITLAVFVSLLIAPSAGAKACPSFIVGTASFSKIAVTRTTCDKARSLLDRTTLAKNRKGKKSWSYAGWTWKITARDESSNKITGKAGSKRVSAIWASI